MTIEVVRVGHDRIAAPVHDDLRQAPLGVLLVVATGELLRHVRDHEVAVHGGHGSAARAEAGIPCQVTHGEVRRPESRMSHIGDLVAIVAAGADMACDGLRTIVLPDGAHLLFDDVQRLGPGYLLPLVLATLAHALHGMPQTGGVVHIFGHLKAAHAERSLVEGVVGVALYLLQLPVLGVVQHATAIMASRT